ncbi:hypothetical protein BDV26DRAFT_278411 [Aspergillus bertholletiae]|uniref:Uncharacterized protein n=1 Tax=Aspergillus bertholletiae TaxID=1226010 RepID=A0A5N7BJR2_9EURO|nr:hypothetical protein BDV26DRAFT_278411 [Aspergillus bertholletiae]
MSIIMEGYNTNLIGSFYGYPAVAGQVLCGIHEYVFRHWPGRDDQWSYRIPYAVQWIWPVPLFFIGVFMPESPWWQVRQGQKFGRREMYLTWPGLNLHCALSSTRLQSKTICLARNAYYIAITAANVIEPYMMNPAAWNWRGKTAFFYRTFEELDIMFAAGVPTRKFRTYHVDPYAEDIAIQNRARESPIRKSIDMINP